MLLWVAVVTILIWVYADLEFTQTQEVTVTFVLETGPGLIQLTEYDTQRTFKVQGNRNGVDRFEQVLKSRNFRLPVDISDQPPRRGGLSIEALLARNEEFQQSGLAVVPGAAELRLNLDSTVVKTVDIHFAYTGAELLREATLTPHTVEVRCAKSRWDELVQAKTPLVIHTQELNLQNFAAGKPQTHNVKLRPQIGTVNVVIDGPATVSAEFQIERKKSDREFTLNVRVQMPPSWLEDDTWKLYEWVPFDKGDWQQPVKVIGSPEALEQLQARSKEIDAFIRLTEEDKSPATTWTTRKVTVRFPPDLGVELDGGEDPKVQFRLDKR